MAYLDIKYEDYIASDVLKIRRKTPNVTRRPASADRTARAANFRRDLEAT